MLILALLVAAALRFYLLGAWPPGLYRDEAYNGLDALAVLAGRLALYFPANNGREPTYIYLTAAAVRLLGQTPLAVRLGAAMTGTATTLVTYALARSWFGRRVGLLAAWLWAITLWPVHLSRIGLRPILLPLALGAAFWLGTAALRRGGRGRWLLAGAVYGAAFYTYLAARFTPLLLAALALYWLATRRPRPALSGIAWGGLGALLALLPLAVAAAGQPQILIGRVGQVSILNAAMDGGELARVLGRQLGATLGMFFWQGDTILRHNPAGRPVFDPIMALPFLAGVLWCLRRWRRPAAAVLLLWVGVMLGPTLLAADAPHFLRAVGVLPALVILPALGLAWLGQRWPGRAGSAAVGLLLTASTLWTVIDYTAYARAPDTGYLFEAAARALAGQVNQAPEGTTVFIDERFWSGWPSVRFLVTHPDVVRFAVADGLSPLPRPARLILWPYTSLDFVAPALPPPALVTVAAGPLARGDLEPEAYPLYSQVWIAAAPAGPPVARFGAGPILVTAAATRLEPDLMAVDLVWTAAAPPAAPVTAFVHVTGPNGLVAQQDAPPGQGLWPASWWRAGLFLQERRTLQLPETFDPAQHQVTIGLYDPVTLIRQPVTGPDGQFLGDSWQLPPEQEPGQGGQR